MARQKGAWFSNEPKCSAENFYDCLGPFNEELIDPILNWAERVLYILILFSALLCLICYKKRSLASAFITLESLIRICVIFLPNSIQYPQNPVNLTLQMGSLLVMFFVHEASSIISTTLALTLQVFVGWHIVYMKPMTIPEVITDIALILLYFLTASAAVVMI